MRFVSSWFHALMIGVTFLSLCKKGVTHSKRGEPSDETYKYFKMPGAVPKKNDDYLCTAMALNSSKEEWVVMYDPLASANRAHHMLLYGCEGVEDDHLKDKYWDCGHHGVCKGSNILFAWAKNAPGTHLPPGVGFRIGGKSSIQYLVLQIHYATTLPEGIKDESGLRMTITNKVQKYKAGIYLLLSGFIDIPPLTPKTHVDANCKLGTSMVKPINIFGFRVHAHSLGSVITGYKYDSKTSNLTQIVKGNPQWPQAFYPMNSILRVELDDILHVRCTYNSTTRDRHTYAGQTAADEMCNLYLMYYTDRVHGSDSGVCVRQTYNKVTHMLPADSDVALPPNADLEKMTKGENVNKDKQILYTDLFAKTPSKPTSNFDAEKALAAYMPKPKAGATDSYYKSIHMPDVAPTQNDAYICTMMPLNTTQEEWVTMFNPLASANRAHHMLLFGCSDVNRKFIKNGAWDCVHHGVCAGSKIMYAWAKNAPATHLPDGVGFRIGGATDVKYLVLQIHYAKPLPQGQTDDSGLQMTVTTNPQKFKAGIFLLAAGFVDIPPYTEKTHADINCEVRNTEKADINIFAFRVHAHKLGSVISGYKYDPDTNLISEIAKGNPHWPQAFYPMDTLVTARPKDVLHARCTFNSSTSIKHTYIGPNSNDEMCNLYLMYYTDTQTGSESGGCGGEQFRTLTSALPPSSDEPLPPNPLLEEMTHGENVNKDKEVSYSSVFKNKKPIEMHKKTQSRKDPQQHPGIKPEGKYQLKPKPVEIYNDYSEQTNDVGRVQYYGKEESDQKPNEHIKETFVSSPRQGKGMNLDSGFHLIEDWGPSSYKLGQVAAVAVDSSGDVVIFHRGERRWDGSSFKKNVFVDQQNPIPQPTLLHLRTGDGEVMHEWGANFFFMPHGLSIDEEDNIWVTDVGMQQVFKFPSGFGQGKPLLTLGTKFKIGNDDSHFCQPTDVVVLKNKEFFVSDGYCNRRIIHFSATGHIIKQIGASSNNQGPKMGFSVPHSLTLANDESEVCVADREHGRVQCFSTDTGTAIRTFKFDDWGSRLFAIAYTPYFGGKLFCVNGPTFISQQTIEVYEVSYEEGSLVQSFSPFNQGLSNPHDIEVSPNGTELYVVEIGPNRIWKFVSDTVAKNRSTENSKTQNIEVKTGQLKEDIHNTLSLFSGGYSSLSVSSVVLGLVAIPIVVILSLAVVMRCRRKGGGNRYLDNSKFMNGMNKGGGLNLGSLLNKRRGFEQVSTNDIDEEELDSADSDVEEFSLTATKV